MPGFDGPMTTVVGPDGRTWAAWAYRSSHESDIAISTQDGSTTAWSEPVFLGHGNGFDDVDPALAVDSRGAIYLALQRQIRRAWRLRRSRWFDHMVQARRRIGAEVAASPS
jgi:hypothetical protein